MKHTDPRYFDPIDVDDEVAFDDRGIIITPNEGLLRLKSYRPLEQHSVKPARNEIAIDLTPEQLRDALNQIPGFNVRYDRPAPAVPQGLGAVIRSPKGYYIRTAPANLNPWRNTSTGAYYSDEYLVERLIEGAEVLSEGVML